MKTKDFGHKTPEEAYCSGYTDEHGHWNNGFLCPMWAGPDKDYCCGPATHRYCCVQQEQGAESANTTTYVKSHVPLVVGLGVSLAILCLVAVVLTCLFCRCCCLYKRRKRRFTDYDDMTGEEMERYFSNEFVLIPGQGTFCPGILEGSEHSSQKSLCPRELHLKRDVCNLNAAYSSSNVSDATTAQNDDVTLLRATSRPASYTPSFTNSLPRYAMSDPGLERDSGCFVTQNDHELSGVRSLFATLDRKAMSTSAYSHRSGEGRSLSSYSHRSGEDACTCQMDGNAVESSTGLLESCTDKLSHTSHTSSSDMENIIEQREAVTEVPCCQRNKDPHEHSKV